MRVELHVPPIRIDLNVTATNEGAIEKKLDAILEMLRAQRGKEDTMLQATQDLIDEVTSMESVVEGVEKVVDDFIAKIGANTDDPVAIQAALDEFRAQKARIAAAVAKGTAAEEPAPPAAPPA